MHQLTGPTRPAPLHRAPVRVLAGASTGALLAWRTATAAGHLHGWPRVAAVVVMALVGGALAPLARLLHTPGAVPAVLLCWLAAVYGCVPETDQVRQAAGLLAGFAAAEVIARHAAPWPAHLVGAAGVLWCGLYGATGYARAEVGAVFGAWTVLLPAAVATLVPPLVARAWPIRWAVAGVAVVAALAVARTGALHPPVSGALRSAAVAAAVSAPAALAVALGGRSRRRPG